MTDFNSEPVYLLEGSTLTMGSVVSSSSVRKGWPNKKTAGDLKKKKKLPPELI